MTKKSPIDQDLEFSGLGLAFALTAQPSQSPPTAPIPPLDFSQGNFIPGEVIVKFGPQLGAAQRAKGLDMAASLVGGRTAEVLQGLDDADPGSPLVARLTLGKGVGVEQAIQALSKLADVSVAEPNWIFTTQATANESSYTNGTLWGMLSDTGSLATTGTTKTNAFGSQANEAWATDLTGSMRTVVGVVDSGIDYRHPDLYPNIWLNQKEIPTAILGLLADTDGDDLITFRDLNHATNRTNAQQYLKDWNANGYIDAGDLLDNRSGWENAADDDGNGYWDDLIGWDFINNDNDPMDDNNHGTHVSGTIGGVGGNGVGVAGVNWNVQLMGLKFLGANGSGALDGALKAVNYYTAAAKAATVENFVATNNSWGGGGFSQTLLDAIVNGAKQDVLFVAAAGNGGRDGVGDNNDTSANYPSNYSTSGSASFDAVIAVASITSSGALSSFSNYGVSTVDIGAPGSSILSTTPNGGYSTFSGTSMATPHVTGALALRASMTPTLTGAELKALFLDTAADTTSLAGKTVSGGRLDIGALIGQTPPPPPEASPSIWGTAASDSITGTSGSESIAGVPATGTDLGKGTIDRLTGLAGADVFLLGDARGRFYDDASAKTNGNADYGVITDFSRAEGDRIQLKSGSGGYFISNVTFSNGVSGAGLYHDSNANGRFGTTDELIGVVSGVTSSYLQSSDFLFV